MKVYINNKIYFKSIYPNFKINNENASSFFINQLKRREDKVVLVDEDLNEMKSYQLISNIHKVTKGLQDLLHLNKDDKVGVLLPNILEFTYSVLGVVLGGGIVSQINPNSTKEEINNTLSTVLPKFIIINHSSYIRIKEYVTELFPACETVIIVPDNNNYQPILNSPIKTINLNQLMDNDGSYNNYINSTIDSTKDIALILFSSGTSGNFKGVCLTHSNIISSIHQVIASEYSNHIEPQKLLCCSPLFHCYGFITPFLSGLSYGLCLYFIKSYNIKKVLQIIQNENITLAFIVPSIGIDLAKSKQALDYNCLSLKTLLSGGSVFPNDIIDSLKSRFGYSINTNDNSIIKQLKVRQGYGCTECCMISHTNAKSKIKNGSSGFTGPNSIVKIVDIESGNQLDSNQIGEICFKGPNIMKEYFNNPIATNDALDDEGFFLTGDIGYIDNDGEIFITDRKKELIKHNGNHISPTEIESILLTHPKIKEVCVVGVQSDESGQVPRAFIVSNDKDITRKEVHKWLNSKVSPYKALSGGIVFIDKLPKSSSGKVLKRILKTQSKL